MFTGIIQAMGRVRSIRRGSTGAHLVLDAPDLVRPIADGASICVSGVCLTVTGNDASRIEFDIVPESLNLSTLGGLAVGDRVGLEPSLRLGDPVDGHTVQGHVDGIARVRDVRRSHEGHVVTFETDASLIPYMIPKGSVAIDGVSLTLTQVADRTFGVALIPTTLAVTTLSDLRVGDRVNVETDILARTIVTTMQRASASPSGLTLEKLRENGW